MIEHEWFTSAQNHHPSLKKSIAPLLHIVIFLTFNKCRNRTFFCMKSEWGIVYIDSSQGETKYFSSRWSGRKSSSGRPRQTLEKFDFRFTFLRRKRAFFMHVLKKIAIFLTNFIKYARNAKISLPLSRVEKILLHA